MREKAEGCRGKGKAQSKEHVLCNKLTKAHKLLSEIYHRFTKGFDTRDLQEAKVLLYSLASRG
jgi:hypothetical protein